MRFRLCTGVRVQTYDGFPGVLTGRARFNKDAAPLECFLEVQVDWVDGMRRSYIDLNTLLHRPLELNQ